MARLNRWTGKIIFVRWISLGVSLFAWVGIIWGQDCIHADIADDIEYNGYKDVRGSSEQQGDILAKAQRPDDGTNEVSKDVY